MRKSLGNKRNEVCDDQRDEITRLYGNLTDADHVRIFDNEDFGYQRITVERPLKLNFAVNEERIERLKETTAFANLATSKKRKDTQAAREEIEAGKQKQQEIIQALHSMPGDKVWKNRDTFLKDLKAAFKKASVVMPPAPLLKAIVCLLYTSPSPRASTRYRMPSSA